MGEVRVRSPPGPPSFAGVFSVPRLPFPLPGHPHRRRVTGLRARRSSELGSPVVRSIGLAASCRGRASAQHPSGESFFPMRANSLSARLHAPMAASPVGSSDAAALGTFVLPLRKSEGWGWRVRRRIASERWS
jgi:hypothetical protein